MSTRREFVAQAATAAVVATTAFAAAAAAKEPLHPAIDASELTAAAGSEVSTSAVWSSAFPVPIWV